MGFFDIMKNLFSSSQSSQSKAYSRYQEVGGYTPYWMGNYTNSYRSELVKASIRTLSEQTSKANAKCIMKGADGVKPSKERLERLLTYRPNMYMNGKEFLEKVRNLYEINNQAFILIVRDDKGSCTSLYPVPSATCEALDYNGRLYIKFTFANNKQLIASWEDLAVLRKDYVDSDIFADTNEDILTTVNLLNTLNQGQRNAIKSTSNLRGIIKSTVTMLDPEDLKKQKEQFERDYMNLDNEGGIASLDASQEFIPIKMEPVTANYQYIAEMRENIYRYFGVNDEIIQGKATAEQWEQFYESRIEPFLIDLGLELTNKIFTDKEIGYGNQIIFEANRMAYVSTSAKLQMSGLIDRGVITINEYRMILNLAPIEGGDIRVIRKEYAEAQHLNEIQGIGEE